jgi:hypothetical protein
LPPSGSLSGKRREPSVTPSATAEEGMLPTLNDASSSSVVVDKKKEKERQKKEQQKEKQKEKEQEEPPKKKRRVALTRVGDVGSGRPWVPGSLKLDGLIGEIFPCAMSCWCLVLASTFSAYFLLLGVHCGIQ